MSNYAMLARILELLLVNRGKLKQLDSGSMFVNFMHSTKIMVLNESLSLFEVIKYVMKQDDLVWAK
jgi:hypothetical protein